MNGLSVGYVSGLMLVLCLGPALAEEPTSATAVTDCAARNAPESTIGHYARFNTTDGSGGSRELLTRLYAMREDEALNLNLRIVEPLNLAGTTYLIREKPDQDDMRVYIPALRKVRRVTGNMAATDLWGTSFSYLDIKLLFGAFIDGERELGPDETISGRPTVKLLIRPSDTEGAPFERLAAVIDKETCVILAIDFLDVESQPVKRLTASLDSIQSFDERMLATRYRMDDLLSGVTTDVELSKLEFDEDLGRAVFNTRGFADAR